MTAPSDNFQVTNCCDPAHEWHEVLLHLQGLHTVELLFPNKAAAEQFVDKLWTTPVGRMHEPSEAVITLRAYQKRFDPSIGIDTVIPVFFRTPRIQILAASVRPALILVHHYTGAEASALG